MTIKRQLFFSNLRMVLVSLGAFALVTRIVINIFHGAERPNQQILGTIRDYIDRDTAIAAWILIVACFVILFSVINNVIAYRMTKRIVKPLEPLGEGVRQIQSRNYGYRIDYQNNDEFLPICEAFNEMAARLETSTKQRKEDETNRRELIAGISHDLLTPLTSIKGCIEGIETGIASTPEMQRKYHTIIKNKTENLESIIKQLFLFSKLDMNEFPLDMRSIDIVLAVSEIAKDSLSEFISRGLVIELSKMPENVYVLADVLLLRNVIINIFENSVKYRIKDRGRIGISASLENNFVLLRFADDGPGVQADMLPKLFDVFYRTDPSRSKSGSGLGLAVSAKIIERMGGSIYAELPSTGGLAIVIKLPLLKGEVR